MNPSCKLTASMFLILVLCFVARITSTYYIFNEVIDENLHVKAGLEYLEYGRYTLEVKHPPLARAAVAALPYFFGNLRLPKNQQFLDWLWSGSDSDNYWKTLALARAGNLLFGFILLFFTYRWAARLHDPKVGLAACILVSCSPDVIGHSGLATLDTAAAATTVAAAYYFWRWCLEPAWRTCLLAGLWTGVAWATKFSTVAFLPVIGCLFIILARWRRSQPSESLLMHTRLSALGRCMVFGLVVTSLVWTVYLFDIGTIASPSPTEIVSGKPSLSFTLGKTLASYPLPAPQFWQGLLDIMRHNEGTDGGWKYYLVGQISQHGWWYYFLVALLVKTTLPFLCLFVASLAGLFAGLSFQGRRGILFPIVSFFVILGIGMLSDINLGIRHILGVYPLMAIVVAGVCFSYEGLISRGKLQLLALVVLLAWHVGESLLAHPDYLAYFNEIARGKEQAFLADSNLDWGQDMARLGRYMKAEKIESVELHCFCYPSPALFGIATNANSGRPFEIAAVSTHLLLGLGEHEDPSIQRFREMIPFDRVGKSIWLFHIAPPPPAGTRLLSLE